MSERATQATNVIIVVWLAGASARPQYIRGSGSRREGEQTRQTKKLRDTTKEKQSHPQREVVVSRKQQELTTATARIKLGASSLISLLVFPLNKPHAR